MSQYSVKDQLKAFGVEKVLGLIQNDPVKNIPRILDWVDRLDRDDVMLAQRQVIREALGNTESNWYQLLLSLWDDIDDEVRKKVFQNFVVNSSILGFSKLEQLREMYDCNIPWAILMDPTSACNLNCTGCWAAEYGNKLNLSLEVLDSIVEQAKAMGTYMFLFSGGEPLVRKDDILSLCEKHSDCVFLAFTNGTLIDEDFADEMLRVKNFIPAISIEGFEKETDDRRGAGTYQKVIAAMEVLKKKKLPFGASCCYTSRNTEVIGSEKYMDFLVESGAKFVWYFTYMPVGEGAPAELIAAAEQREYMYHQIRKFRSTKPIFTIDFWNDGEYIEGCVAGGRCYMHINANGDIEPCAFIHYSDSNIKEKTLLEAYQSGLFMEYKNNQPFNSNHLRPCPLLDNNGKLAEMVHRCGAYSTDLAAPENVDSLCAKCREASENWQKTADKLWSGDISGVSDPADKKVHLLSDDGFQVKRSAVDAPGVADAAQ